MEDELLDVIDDLEENHNLNIDFKKNEVREEKTSTKSEFKKVFTSIIQFKEFMTFLKNGFRIK